MTETAQPPRRPLPQRILLVTLAIASILGLSGFFAALPRIGRAFAAAKPLHAPELGRFLAEPVLIQVHVAMALAAVLLGGAMMLSRKGARFHRIAGWAWAGLMLGLALSSIAMGLTTGRWSFVHLLAAWVLVAVPLAVLAARRHKRGAHRGWMLWLYYGSLIGAGVFTFAPGRFMWSLFFG